MKHFLSRFGSKKTNYGNLVNREHLMHALSPEELMKNMVQNEKNAHPKTVLENRDFSSLKCKVEKGRMGKQFIEALKRHKLMIGDYGNVMWETRKQTFYKESGPYKMEQTKTYPYEKMKPTAKFEYGVEGFMKYEWDDENHFYRTAQFFDKNGNIYCLWKKKGNAVELLLMDPHALKPIKTEMKTDYGHILNWKEYIKRRFRKATDENE